MNAPSPSDAGGYTGQLDREAAQWCMHMHGSDAEQLRPAFERWLRLGALHREAYNKIEEIYLLGARARWPEGERTSLSSPGRSRAHPGAPWILAGAGAATIAVAVSLTTLNAPIEPGLSVAVRHDQRPVEIRASLDPQRFALRDGSEVQLEPTSALQVAFTPRVRRLTLLRGEGLFAVAHEVRPFSVDAGQVRVTARGTAFLVHLEADRSVDVRVLRGVVEVSEATPSAQTPPAIYRLRAGSELHVAATGPRPEPTTDPTPERSALYQPRTLGDLVAAANASPGTAVRIEVTDPALLSLKLGGSFRVHDPDAVAERLAGLLDVEVVRERPGHLLLRRVQLTNKASSHPE